MEELGQVAHRDGREVSVQLQHDAIAQELVREALALVGRCSSSSVKMSSPRIAAASASRGHTRTCSSASLEPTP